MGLFGKKHEPEELEVQNEEEATKKPLLTPRKTRRKKEPIQPWTKKERLFIFYVLLFTVITSALLALTAREWKLPGLPQIEFKLPSLAQGTITLEGNGSKLDTQDKQLITDFKKATNDLSGKYGFFYKDLETGKEVNLYGDEIFQAASMIKVPVMISLYEHRPDGYEELVEKMGQKSDNTAFREARKILGDDKINATIQEYKMVNTSLDENETTMRDMANVFEILYKDAPLGDKPTGILLDTMKDTIYEDHLAAGVPDNINVSHKYGREVHVVNDGGIVFAPKRYVVIIMSKGVVESEADNISPRLSELIFNFSQR